MNRYTPLLCAIAAVTLYATAVEAKVHVVNSARTTLEAVADYYGIPRRDVLKCNPKMSRRRGHKVKRGERVLVAHNHQVQSGETYGRIAAQAGISKLELDKYNRHIENRNRIRGKTLYVPCTSSVPRRNCRTARFDSGLELCVVSGRKARKLKGDSRCMSYSYRSSSGKRKLEERCQFYSPRGGTLVEVTARDLDKPVSRQGNVKLYEITRCNFPWLIPRQHRISWRGEWFFRYTFVQNELLRKLERLRSVTGKAIKTARRSWKLRLGDGRVKRMYCTPDNIRIWGQLGRRHSPTTRKKSFFYRWVENCRKHVIRPFSYNIRMNREIDKNSVKRKSDHVDARGADLAIPFAYIRSAVMNIFESRGRYSRLTHVGILRKRDGSKRLWGKNWRRPVDLEGRGEELPEELRDGRVRGISRRTIARFLR